MRMRLPRPLFLYTPAFPPRIHSRGEPPHRPAGELASYQLYRHIKI